MEKNGFYEMRRVRGQNFCALGFGNARDLPLKVRVVTRRGIALALDPEPSTPPLSQGARYELLDAPVSGTQDADGDGFEEVFIAVQHDTGPACLAVYRVRDSGFVDAAPDFAMPAQVAASRALRGAALCAAPPESSDTAADPAGAAANPEASDSPAKPSAPAPPAAPATTP
jgi:hypothetical protein